MLNESKYFHFGVIRDLWTFLAQVVGEKAKVALKDFVYFSRRTNTVVKAQWGSNGFSWWAAPLSLLVTDVAMGFLAFKLTQRFLGLPLLPAEFDLAFIVLLRFFTNDKVVRGVPNAESASPSVFLFHWIMEGNRRVRLIPELQNKRIVLHQVDPCKFNRAALCLNDDTHFAAGVANRDVLTAAANAA